MDGQKGQGQSQMFRARGNIRGSCEHKHRTLKGAVRCMNRDSVICKSQGGYSDRNVYETKDGKCVLWVKSGHGKYDFEPVPQDTYL